MLSLWLNMQKMQPCMKNHGDYGRSKIHITYPQINNGLVWTTIHIGMKKLNTVEHQGQSWLMVLRSMNQ